jgi:hypothetical protein
VAKSAPDRAVVEAIVEELEPWQHRWSASEILLAVAEQVNSIRVADDFYSRAAKLKTREDAGDIITIIGRLRRQFRTVSPELNLRLYLSHRPKLFHELAMIEQECKRAIEAGKNEKGRKDEVKQWCARTAHSLIVRYSEKEPTSGSPKAPFRAIAGLLYGCVHPDRETADLKRPCDNVLKLFQAAGIRKVRQS